MGNSKVLRGAAAWQRAGLTRPFERRLRAAGVSFEDR